MYDVVAEARPYMIIHSPPEAGDKAAALRSFETAARLAPASRRNQYYVCLSHVQAGRYDKARESCAAARSARCVGAGEPDICEFLTAQVERLMRMAQQPPTRR